MRLIHRDDKQLVFRLVSWEKQFLLEVLGRYPVLPPKFQPMNKSVTEQTASQRECQQLLEEALVEQKQELRQRLDHFLLDPERFKSVQKSFDFKLNLGDVEWFLQILNDIRVGSWYQAGCPEEHHWDKMELTPDNATHVFAMEVSGQFQWLLLQELHGPKQSEE